LIIIVLSSTITIPGNLFHLLRYFECSFPIAFITRMLSGVVIKQLEFSEVKMKEMEHTAFEAYPGFSIIKD